MGRPRKEVIRSHNIGSTSATPRKAALPILIDAPEELGNGIFKKLVAMAIPRTLLLQSSCYRFVLILGGWNTMVSYLIK
ncbi:unnamed protein product [Prunus armeniaca]|uniref:Uncharacterized protein n=1 Tax=Prunus armeniaca TaxID=36596 RepID=A0A6J5TQG2_PRUAR|nr:unnamed protein product [Prunus armeniaca]